MNLGSDFPRLGFVKIHCQFLPDESIDISKHVVVVVDVLRATSNICCMFERGVKRVLLLEDEYDCLNHKLRFPNSLLFGERDMLKIKGFDFGNSPSETLSAKLSGKEIVLSTTNGTKAMIIGSKSDQTYIGSLLNLSSICSLIGKMVRSTGRDLTVICSGNNKKITVDDVYLAGAIIHKTIVAGNIRGFEIDDGSRIAKLVHGGFPRAIDALLASDAGRILSARGFSSDIALCAKVDLFRLVPAIKRDGDQVLITCELEE